MTSSEALDSAITVIGMSGIAFTFPETLEVSPVNSHRPSSYELLTGGLGCEGSRTPANAHCVFHHANLR